MKNFLIISSCLIFLGVGWIEAIQVLRFIDVSFPIEGFIVCLLMGSAFFALSLHNRIDLKFVNLILSLAIISLFLIDINSKIITNLEFEILLEHGLKNGIPLITLLFLNSRISEQSAKRFIKICLSLTFIGHGLYAVGLHQVPDSFTSIVTHFFDFSTSEVKNMLFIIGIADILIGLAYLVFPKSKIILYYLLTWTIIVTGARMIASFPGVSFLNWTGTRSPQIIWRLVHVLAPLYLLKYRKVV